MTHPAAVLDRAGLDRLVAVLIAEVTSSSTRCSAIRPRRDGSTGPPWATRTRPARRRARTASASRTRRAWPALGRAPTRLVVFAVEAADLGFGTGLSQSVADALPELTRLVLDELG